MPTTVTAYNTFAAGTRARATDVNTNFNNYRGNLLPINTGTATASTLTHNLGSTDHFWNDSYINRIIFSRQTASGTYPFIVGGGTGTDQGGLDVRINNLTAASFRVDRTIISAPTSTGYVDVLINGVTAAAIDTNGLSRATFRKVNWTTSAISPQMAISPVINLSITLGSQHIANSTLTIQTLGGPVEVFMGVFTQDSSTTGHDIVMGPFSSAITARLFLVVDGSTVSGQDMNHDTANNALNANQFKWFDLPASGSHVYSLCIQHQDSGTSYFRNLRLVAREL